MGIGDSIGGMADKTKDAMSGGKDDEAVDKAAEKTDELTGHKMTGGIEKGAASVKDTMGSKRDPKK